MTDAITAAREAIESRIGEIEQEMKRLQGALAEPGVATTGPQRDAALKAPVVPHDAAARLPRVASAASSSSPTWSRIRGAKPAAIAKAMETTSADVQNVLRKAREDKLVPRRRGGGYALASRPGSRSPAPAAASTRAPTG